MPKTLKPTLRERNRYLILEAISDKAPDRKQVSDAVWGALLRLYGEVGAAKTSLWMMDWRDESLRGILKCTHKSVEQVRASAAAVKELAGRKAIVSVKYVSGTLKGARERL